MIDAKEKTIQKPSVVVDLDGTIAREDSDDLVANEPQPGVQEALRRLRDAGFEVVVFTCRTNLNGTPRQGPEDDLDEIKAWLDHHEVPYDRIDLGYEGKPFGVAYVDNKAVHYDGGVGDWEKVVDLIMARNGHG